MATAAGTVSSVALGAAGVPDRGTDARRITINTDLATCTDPDGLAWEHA
jgi:hypothetical protein